MRYVTTNGQADGVKVTLAGAAGKIITIDQSFLDVAVVEDDDAISTPSSIKLHMVTLFVITFVRSNSAPTLRQTWNCLQLTHITTDLTSVQN